MKEQEILLLATEKLTRFTGAVVCELRLNDTMSQGVDGVIEITLGNKKESFVIDIRNELRNNQFPAVLKNKPIEAENYILVAQYIPKPLKQLLKDNRQNYLEAAGNCYIQTPDLFIYINDQPVSDARLPAEGKLWKSAGLKLLFIILQNPECLNNSYRWIAENAGIALGNVGALLTELKNEGYVREGNRLKEKVLFLDQKETLIQRWAEAFRATLRPKLLIGTFRFIDRNEAKNWKSISPVDFRWGGENAGNLLTNYLHAEKFTLYTKEPRGKLMKALKLVPDPKGNVEILELFWNEELQTPEESKETVPPLLAYAELITSFDSRNRETAERIKLKYLG